MNLDNLVDGNHTTRKMRAAIKRDDTTKELKRLSKRKNSNPDARNVQPVDGPSTGQSSEDAPEADAAQVQFDA